MDYRALTVLPVFLGAFLLVTAGHPAATTPNVLPATTFGAAPASGSSNQVWWVGASSTDPSAMSNTGVKGSFTVVSFSTQNVLDAWVADDLTNSIWGQVGYYIMSGQGPVAFYQIWNLSPQSVLTTGTTSVSTGTHTFSMYLQGGTTWAFALDGVVFGTYDMGASTSSSSYPVYALVEEQAPSVFSFPTISFSPAIQVLKSGTWSDASAANSYGTVYGVEGHDQNSALSADQIDVGSSIATLSGGTPLWSSASTTQTSSFSAPTTSTYTTTVTSTLTQPVTSTVTSTVTSRTTSTVTQPVTSTVTHTTTSGTTSTVTSPTTTTRTVTTTQTSPTTVTSTQTVSTTATSTRTVSTTATSTETSTTTSASTTTQKQTTTVTSVSTTDLTTTKISTTTATATSTVTTTSDATVTTSGTTTVTITVITSDGQSSTVSGPGTSTTTSTVTRTSPTTYTTTVTESPVTTTVTETATSTVTANGADSSYTTSASSAPAHTHGKQDVSTATYYVSASTRSTTPASGTENGSGVGQLVSALSDPMASLLLVAGAGAGAAVVFRRAHSHRSRG